MSEPAVQWRQLLRFLKRNGFDVDTDGGDVLISKDSMGKVHRIGHKFCNRYTAHISPGHLSKLRQKFGITRKDILSTQ